MVLIYINEEFIVMILMKIMVLENINGNISEMILIMSIMVEIIMELLPVVI